MGAMEELQAVEGRQPLFSDAAEQAVLGALLRDGEIGSGAWDRMSGLLVSADFYISNHVHVFAAINKLCEANRPADVLTVAAALKDAGKLADIGGVPYLQELREASPSVVNVVHYAKIVRDQARLRALARVAAKIQESLIDPRGRDATALMDEAQAAVLALNEAQTRASAEYVTIGEALIETMAHLDAASKALADGKSLAVATGFTDLDTELGGGFYPGELIILGAGPSQGKSAFAMNIAEHVGGTLGRAASVNVMEMPAMQLAMRALASASAVNSQRLREGRLYEKDWEKINAGLIKLNPMPIFIDATPELSIDDIRSRVRRLSRRCDLALVIVDYLQLVKVNEHANRVTEIGKVSRGLKGLAMQLKVPVLALSSLNRERFKRADRRPNMGDLRESGDIEADADVIMFLHREAMYNPGQPQPGMGEAELIIAKQRSGTLSTVTLGFKGDLTRFVDWRPPEGFSSGGNAYAKSRDG